MRALVLSAAIVAAAAPAMAQQPICKDPVAMAEWLLQEYGETLRSFGLAGARVVETFANAETQTWTVVISDASGRSCIAAAGEAWEEVPPAPTGRGL